MVKPFVSDQVFGPKTAFTVQAPGVAMELMLKTAVTTPVVVLREK
jgi:hypothetical protein